MTVVGIGIGGEYPTGSVAVSPVLYNETDEQAAESTEDAGSKIAFLPTIRADVQSRSIINNVSSF